MFKNLVYVPGVRSTMKIISWKTTKPLKFILKKENKIIEPKLKKIEYHPKFSWIRIVRFWDGTKSIGSLSCRRFFGFNGLRMSEMFNFSGFHYRATC